MHGAVSEHVVAELELHPPERLAVGRGNAFVIGGYCYHPEARTRSLFLELDGNRQRVERFRLPRGDLFDRAADTASAPHAFRSGFVDVIRVSPRSGPSEPELRLVLGLDGGREVLAPMGRMRLEPGLEPPAETAPARFAALGGPRVAICMATFDPPPELLRRQLDSIRKQTHRNWICLISDDCSPPDAYRRLEAEVEGDARFVLSPGPRRLGFYANFERALAMTPGEAEFVTLCDQDDRWHPRKLELLLDRIAAGAQLVYSDARVVSPDGEVIQPSYWSVRTNNYANFASLLLANSVTGAASLFRRELLDDVLPLPPRFANAFHDHWLAVVALAQGEIDYIDEPLYDYVQHPTAVIGHSEANRPPRRIRQHLVERLRKPGTGARMAYYYHWHQQLLFDEVLRIRCWDKMTASKRRTLGRLLSADRGVRGVAGIGWLLGRRLRRLWGHDETLDRELVYAYALARRRAVSLWTLGRRRPSRVLPRDASIPPAPDSR